MKPKILALAAALCCLPLQNAYAKIDRQTFSCAIDSINRYMQAKAAEIRKIDIDTFYIKGNRAEIHLNSAVSDYPIRDIDIQVITNILESSPGIKGSDIEIELFTGKVPLDKLASGYYSGRKNNCGKSASHDPWIMPEDLSYITEGLYGRGIALWAGHGYYYCSEEDRWKWQRAPFFSTIEDLLAHSYITGFLAPMLENAGACVMIPRERDPQRTEIIVDNGDSFYSERNASGSRDGKWEDTPSSGFGKSGTPYTPGRNPFNEGTARMTGNKSGAEASYRPFFPESGDYAVYVSYQSLENSTLAEYTVRYSGGERKFTVDQRIGGGTWVYLGTFRFTKGETDQGVTVAGSAHGKNGTITADAVKFGGGMGNMARGGETSGFPRYAEAATYWLQWSGFPENVYLQENGNDYKNDYMSRGEWVNSMKNDFGIPVDLAVALHTDAGSHAADSIVGTLAIYKEVSDNKATYSDGRQRITARELADIIQTSIVEDIRASYRRDWTRRGIRDRSYVEARVPDVPAALIELLSHQNFADMQCALDPKFKFIVSRSIYKGILKYLSYTSGEEYTVQPLPVKDFSAVLSDCRPDGASVNLRWTPVQDSLEPSAVPESYIVYRRVTDPESDAGMTGFDSGTKVSGTEFTDRIIPGMMYSYKVVAINKGGVSFPSETLSAGYIPGSREILAVNGFTDVKPHETFDRCDSSFAGFNFKAGYGIPYIRDTYYIGEQYEYDKSKTWIHDDRPGFGASYTDYGPETVAGNTFDYPAVHGLAIMRSGLSFSSTSIGGFLSGIADSSYLAIDLIFGKQKSYPRVRELYDILYSLCSKGTGLIVSGTDIGKSSDYDYDKQYPVNTAIKEAAGSLNAVSAKLSAVKDSINSRIASGTNSTVIREKMQLTADIDSLMKAVTLLGRHIAGDLNGDMADYMRNFDDRFTMNRLASDIFRFQWSNGYASSSGQVRTVTNPYGLFGDKCMTMSFPTAPNPEIYCAASPDAIIPYDNSSYTFMRYGAGNTSAAVAYSGTYRCVSFGFPIETITSQHQIDTLMREVIKFISSAD